MTFIECRLAWRKDWLAMKAGTYEAPLPHPKMFDCADPRNVERGKLGAAERWGNNSYLNGHEKTE